MPVTIYDGEINQLAQKIAEKILELNGKAPQAVMLIGGGSKTPKLTEKVAGMLEIPANRVAVRGADAVSQFVGTHPLINGPEFVTPVGIAVAARRHPIKYVTVTVNELAVRIFDLRKMTLGDALITAGLDIRRLFGRPGLAMTITVNGRMKIIPGGHGTPPVLTKNGEPAGLDTPLSDGDIISVVAGQDGAEAKAIMQDLLDNDESFPYRINGEHHLLGAIATRNGEPCPLDTPLHDRDEVEIRLPRTVLEVLQHTGAIPDNGQEAAEKRISFTLNGQDYSLPQQATRLLLNGQPTSFGERIRPNDELTYIVESQPIPAVRDVVPPEEWVQEEIKVTFNGKPVRLPMAHIMISMDGEIVSPDEPIRDGAIITVKAIAGKNPLFSDVFRYVEVSLEQPTGGGLTRLTTLVNGEPASFQTELQAGDRLELYWE